jgi:hypothetical protein
LPGAAVVFARTFLPGVVLLLRGAIDGIRVNAGQA